MHSQEIVVMTRKFWRISLVLTALTVVSLLASQPVMAQRYSVTDLGTLPGFTSSSAFAINNANPVQVAGWSGRNYPSDGHAFVWDSVSGMQDLGTIEGAFSAANGINDAGQVVGFSNASGGRHAFLYDSTTGQMQDLLTLGGSFSVANGINNAGLVVGYSHLMGTTIPHAFLWDSVNGMQDLGTLGGSNSYAAGINNADPVQIAGSAAADMALHAVLWDTAGGVQDLGPSDGISQANGLNDNGVVVGLLMGVQHAFLWDSVGGMRDLGTLGGPYIASYASGINNNNQVVGFSNPPRMTPHAFIWDLTNGMRDLNDLIPAGSGWVLTKAEAINNAGQIVGSGSHNGQSHAFLLTPQ